MKKFKPSDWTRLNTYFCTDRNTVFVIAQYADNSIVAREEDLTNNISSELRSPVLNSFFKMLEWIKATENLSNRDIYINRVNRQID